MISASPSCFLVAGAHVDMKGQLNEMPVPGVSNPGKMTPMAGGASLNSATTMQALGIETAIYGLIGNDWQGRLVSQTLEERGIENLLERSPEMATGSYTSIIEPSGDLIIALADLGINDAINADSIWELHAEQIKSSDCLFLNSNLKPTALLEMAMRTGRDNEKRIAATTISPAKAPRLAPILPALDHLFTNLGEARALTGHEAADHEADQEALCRLLMVSGVRSGTISNGANPLFYWHNGEIDQITPTEPDEMVDVTGAGDALTGATLAMVLNGKPFPEAVHYGMAASRLTLESKLPVPEHLNLKRLEAERMRDA